MAKYVFKPYNSIFPKLFEREKERLSEFLTGVYQIEHVGSTAVPNLGGKGIIDIYIVADKKDLERISGEVLKAGYEYKTRISADQHIFHRIDLPDTIEGMRRYHIHISNYKAQDFEESIKFRDYLRKHPEDAKRYSDIKQKAASQADDDKDKYMLIKSPMIKDILLKASRE